MCCRCQCIPQIRPRSAILRASFAVPVFFLPRGSAAAEPACEPAQVSAWLKKLLPASGENFGAQIPRSSAPVWPRHRRPPRCHSDRFTPQQHDRSQPPPTAPPDGRAGPRGLPRNFCGADIALGQKVRSDARSNWPKAHLPVQSSTGVLYADHRILPVETASACLSVVFCSGCAG